MEFIDKDPYPQRPLGAVVLGWVVAVVIVIDILWCIF
jgi:hypothetical protein